MGKLETRLLALECATPDEQNQKPTIIIIRTVGRDDGDITGFGWMDLHRLAGEPICDYFDRVDDHVCKTRGRGAMLILIAAYVGDDD
jgi:hypothetical protein